MRTTGVVVVYFRLFTLRGEYYIVPTLLKNYSVVCVNEYIIHSSTTELAQPSLLFYVYINSIGCPATLNTTIMRPWRIHFWRRKKREK